MVEISKDSKLSSSNSLEDLEDWESDYCYINKNDYDGLLKYREQVAKNNPKDYYPQWRLGEAYILNKKYDKAIDFLSKLHKEYPDFGDVQYSLLDALFATGKNENDYNWTIKPPVLRLDKYVLDFCYDFLKNKRKGRSISAIYCELLPKGYLRFEEDDLFKALVTDERFEIENDESVEDSLVRVIKKSKRKKG